MALKDKVQRVEKEYAMGGSFYKFEAGEHRIRILIEPVEFEDWLNGERKVSWITYITSRPGPLAGQDGKIHTCQLPHGIVKFLANLQEDQDYNFTEYPVPYDLKISVTGSGLQKRYEKVPLPKSPVPQEVLDELAEQTPLEELRDKLAKNAATKAPVGRPVTTFDSGDIQPALEAHSKPVDILSEMGQAVEKSLAKPKDLEAVKKVDDMLEMIWEGKQIQQDEYTVLHNRVNDKIRELGGEDQITVEDIPF